MKVYIASFFDTRMRLVPYCQALEEAGHEIVSSWLKETPNVSYKAVGEGYRTACALTDVAEVKSAELLVVDTKDISDRGGREVEVGVAIGSGVPFVVVGPMRNVFHRMAIKHFESWEEALPYLNGIRRY